MSKVICPSNCKRKRHQIWFVRPRLKQEVERRTEACIVSTRIVRAEVRVFDACTDKGERVYLLVIRIGSYNHITHWCFRSP